MIRQKTPGRALARLMPHERGIAATSDGPTGAMPQARLA